MNVEFAPVILFVYKRLDHTILTIESIKKNMHIQETELFIFSDGSKSVKDEEAVSSVRKYVRKISGFR